MTTRSKAPLRISFGGGGTDVPPYPEERGGAVLCATIDKYAYASLTRCAADEIEIHSLDYDVMAKYNANEQLVYNGELDLVKAVIKHLECPRGIKVFIHSDAPPGSGLGSSSAMAVALVGLLQQWLRNPLTAYQIAEKAYLVERIDLGIKGGLQDQFAATFGGFNFIEFHGQTTVVNPLRISPAILNEMEYRLLLCYTGQARVSNNILDHQINGYVTRKDEVVGALDQTKALAFEMKKALLLGRLDDFGDLMNEAWREKKKFASGITSPHIDAMYETALKHGAIGGKLLGAGGGGYLLLFCQFDRKHFVAAELEKLGGQVVEFSFEAAGLQTWEVP